MSSPATASSRTQSAVSSTRYRCDARSLGDSSYFPGCRKDANCHCEICLASIHATRDLLPSAASCLHQSSLTRLSAVRPKKAAPAPVPFGDESPPATPESPDSTVTPPPTPPIQYPVKSRSVKEKSVKKQRYWPLFLSLVRILVWLLLLLAADSGFSAVLSKDFGPKLTPEVISRLGEESRLLGDDLEGMLKLLQQRLEDLLDRKVANCSSIDSNWEMNQVFLSFLDEFLTSHSKTILHRGSFLLQDDQFLFQWRCVLHKSIAERVVIWGSPLKTTGLLATGSPPPWLMLLSGKIKEWSDVNLQSTTRTSNGSSWTYERWSSAVLHLDGETWVLEYKQSALFQGRGFIPVAWEALRLKTTLKWQVFLRRCCVHQEQQIAFPT
ncbi:uncharacterized protein LOC122046539 isoform X1 [Zingiber officinale]|uniref:Uncharacterized protein n=1 Tax=Zingiber officinale TaxID=94328 RepID=A0A8J5HG83_ZINOF|nr:uncharacterized protein LOC122046539 isoform X1 [Zingiber officinale]KAG6525050.1 hypothetical protein ZIOFF_015002 [Zingiber officinale]